MPREDEEKLRKDIASMTNFLRGNRPDPDADPDDSDDDREEFDNDTEGDDGDGDDEDDKPGFKLSVQDLPKAAWDSMLAEMRKAQNDENVVRSTVMDEIIADFRLAFMDIIPYDEMNLSNDQASKMIEAILKQSLAITIPETIEFRHNIV